MRYLQSDKAAATDTSTIDRATQLWVPSSVSQWLQTKLLHFVEGETPKELLPDHKILEQNPTMRGDFIEKVRTGLITIQRAEVDALTSTGLTLSTGVSLAADVIICATGYDQFDLPFLPPDAVRSSSTPPHAVDLYKFIHPPAYPGLFFLGYVELFGPLPSAVEAQARHVAAVLTRRVTLPPVKNMRSAVAAYQSWQAKTFVRSGRHALTGMHVSYIDELLGPLGAAPTVGRLLGKMFRGNPWKALMVLNAVWFGIPSSAQWRLFGHGKQDDLAVETVLRIAGEEGKLRRKEVEALAAMKAEVAGGGEPRA